MAAETGQELRAKLGTLDISVPRQTEGRTTEARERYCIVHYLRTLETHGLVDFPLRISQGESPDCDVIAGSNRFGLEIVEVISQEFARARTKLEEAPEGSLLEGTTVRLPGIAMDGPIAFGDEPERRWTAEALASVMKKSTKLKDYRAFPAYRLLLYDNSEWRVSTAWTVHELPARLAAAIREEPALQSNAREFSEVSVLRDRVLLFDVTGSGYLLPVPTGETLPPLLPLSRLPVSENRLRAFCDEHKIRKLGFFGSDRNNGFGPHSDIDVLVEFESDARISLFDLVGIEQDLTALVERKVNLRTVPELSRYFREDVVRNELELAYVAS
ncbi:MAG: nucleotidyltransferase domain-containing protein [Acidobacteriota bacterium]